MNNLINYIVQSAACLLIFYLFYHIILKKETCFQYNRAYLFFSSLLAFVLPLVDFYTLFDIYSWRQSAIIPAIYLPEITLTSEGTGDFGRDSVFNLYGIIAVLYCCGFVFFLVRFVIRILTIRKIIAQNRYNIKYWQGCYLINTHGKLPTFSFFKYLFWDDSIRFTEREQAQILNHELVHIRQKHSYDIIYFETLGVLFWFNPVIKLYKNAVVDTHEFIADNEVIQATGANHYGHLIVRQLFKRMDLAMGSYFNKSQVYRRLNMIKNNGQKTRWYKLLISMSVVCALTIIMGFDIDRSHTPKFILPNLSITGQNDHQAPYKNLLYIEKPLNMPFRLIRPYADTLILPGFEQPDNENYPKDGGEIYTIVENPPAPKGGMDSFLSYIQENLKYPEQAKKMGIEGRVFVQFVVNIDGTLTDTRVLKGIGAGCNEEAEAVVRNAAKWTPGYQNGRAVRVRMVLPVNFRLG